MTRQLKLTLLALGTLLYPVIFYSQTPGNPPGKNQGIQVGISHVQIKDQSLNNARHMGVGLSVNYFMEIPDHNLIHILDVGLKGSLLTTAFETEMSSFYFQLPLSYRLLFPIQSGGNNPGLFVGGITKILFNIEYFDNWDENHFHWLTSYSMGPAIRAEFSVFGVDRLIIAASLPLISVLSSTPRYYDYTQENSGLWQVIRRMHEGSRIGHPGNFLAPEIEARYHFRRTKRYFPDLVWQVQYINNQGSDGISAQYLQQALGLEIHF